MGAGDRIRADDVPDLAQSDPAGVVEAASTTLGDLDASAHDRAVAAWARGLALRELGESDAAGRDFDFALSAIGGDDPALRSRVLLSSALLRLNRGETLDALSMLEPLEHDIAPADRVQFHLQRGLIRHRLGELELARRDYELGLDESVDPVNRIRLQINLAVLDTYEGDPTTAAGRLDVALHEADDSGQPLLAAFAQHNLGFAMARTV